MELNNKYSIITYDTIDSTNTEAKRLCSNYNIGHLVIWGTKQTHGYGKKNRCWYSGDQNLTFSVIIPHKYQTKIVGHFLFISALSVYHSVKSIFKTYNIKWKIKIHLAFVLKKKWTCIFPRKMNSHQSYAPNIMKLMKITLYFFWLNLIIEILAL